MRTIRLTILTLSILTGITAVQAGAQTPGGELIKQVAAPLPKLALMGTVGETKAGVQYQKIVLAITNWEKYNPDMFVLPIGRRPSVSSCGDIKARIVVTVYSERGSLLSGCIPIPRPAHLSSFSFLIRKGSSVPQLIYSVMNDQHTGAVYRSNLVSPSTGATK